MTTTATGTVLNSSIRTSGSGDEYLQMTVWVQRIGEQDVPRRWYERPVSLLVKQYPDRGIDFSDLIPASPGTQLRITGKVELPPGRRNPNCFDYQLYLKTIGIERVMTAPDYPYKRRKSFFARVAVFSKRSNICTSEWVPLESPQQG